MPSSEGAPKFGFSPLDFTAFFEDVEELARRANLNVAATVKWACRYAGSESESWKYLACLENGRVPATFDVFRREVLQVYPHLDEERRYSFRDLERFVESTAVLADMSREGLGYYYRRFITLSEYLIARGRLSSRERDSLYLRGFPQPIRSQILHRLLYTKLDVLPSNGYRCQEHGFYAGFFTFVFTLIFPFDLSFKIKFTNVHLSLHHLEARNRSGVSRKHNLSEEGQAEDSNCVGSGTKITKEETTILW